MTLQEFQRGLLKLGYNLGPAGADGAVGTFTIQAIIAFKTANGLSPTAAIGPQTMAAMELALAKLDGGVHQTNPTSTIIAAATGPGMEPLWQVEARRWAGLKEVAGKGNNADIMRAAKGLGPKVLKLDYTGDDIPWCGLGMAHWIRSALPTEPLPTYPLRAKDWLNFGVELKEPALGAVAVFGRTGGGHVALYQGEDATHIHVFGANQSDTVNTMRIAKDRLLGYRWPTSVPLPSGGRVMLTAKGVPVSRNEG